jgi:hypothetical protein
LKSSNITKYIQSRVLAKIAATAVLSTLSLSVSANSGGKPVLCIFDIIGKNGPVYDFARDYALAGKSWGTEIVIEAYTDERLVAEDFKTGKCDGMAVTALRGRVFHPFVGSIDAVGGVPSYKHLQTIINLLAQPNSANLMVNGQYEVVGIFPVGAAYVHVNDRSINSIEKAAGKRVAVLDYDKSQARMVQQLGSQPVASEVINFGTKFNNGQVDIVVAPSVAYKPLELYKGIGAKGGIYRFPLLQLTANIIIRKDKFAEGYGQKSREYVAKNFNNAIKQLDKAEKEIPAQTWIDIPQADKDKYFAMMQEARIQLTKEGFYDPKMMKLLKKVRCSLDKTLGECSDKVEG